MLDIDMSLEIQIALLVRCDYAYPMIYIIETSLKNYIKIN